MSQKRGIPRVSLNNTKVKGKGTIRKLLLVLLLVLLVLAGVLHWMLPNKVSEPSNNLANKQSKQTDSIAYVLAQKADSKTSYSRYIEAFPNGENKKQARLKLADRQIFNYPMVLVQAGSFQMGSRNGDDDEIPVHMVTLSEFAIGKYELNQELWQAIMESNPSHFVANTKPVETINWHDAQEFLRKLNAITGKKYRLPTEAEWEYAARGGNKSKGYLFAGSDSIAAVAWYRDCSFGLGELHPDYGTHPVDTKLPNELNIYGMTGNVWEWCSDMYDEYDKAAQTNPQGAINKTRFVFRGGAWGNSTRDSRTTLRNARSGDLRSEYIGIRLVLDNL